MSTPEKPEEVQRRRLDAASALLARAATKDSLKEHDLYNRLITQVTSGHQEGCLYEPTDASSAKLHKRPHFVSEAADFAPLPHTLQREAADELKLYTFSGLFPEIGHAWMTIDHRLFLWDYRVPNATPYTYDGLDQVVITAALARPRRDGTFDPAPDWLLLLSTPVEVLVLALYVGAPAGASASAPVGLEIHESSFSVPTDGVNMVKMAASAGGRIFMAGADGCLYELTYGHAVGWWGAPYPTCAKLNRSRKRDRAVDFLRSAVYDSADPLLEITIDDERRCLYTLSRQSTIQVFDLGKDGRALNFVARLTIGGLHAELLRSGAPARSRRRRPPFPPRAPPRGPSRRRAPPPLQPHPPHARRRPRVEVVESDGEAQEGRRGRGGA